MCATKLGVHGKMLSRLKHVLSGFNLVVRHGFLEVGQVGKGVIRPCSTEAAKAQGVTALFVDERVQVILRRLTGLDLKKVYRKKNLEGQLQAPKYEFMTQEQLNQSLKEAEEKSKEKLQMPPVLEERRPINHVICEDPELIGYDTSNFVFVDINYSISDRKRTIVVREQDGTLRKATWEERDKMNQIYFPKPGRKLIMPSMFEDEMLQEVLERQEYEFILDRACAQFEPDEPNYIRVTRKTYDHIDAKGHYDVLSSTRHYGPMVFCLVMKKSIDNLLIHYIHAGRLEDASELIWLFTILHSDCKTVKALTGDQSAIQVMTTFMENDSQKKDALELSIQAQMELQKQKAEVEQGIRKAHGHG